jgi:protein O-GlcNAc transferase
LVGYRHPLAPLIMFQKPARMQLVNGAFANVFDCPAIDFEIFDQWTALPKWAANGPTRPVMRLEAITHDVEPVSENAARTSGEITVPKSAFTFAIGATAQEISLGSIQLWKTILDQVLNAVIAVPAESDAELRSYHDVLRAGGIGSTRIAQLRAGVADGNRFAVADALLDTIPMSDAIVASEALAAGVAVIALRGPTAPERMAYSVLARYGLTELVADSGPDYIAVAAKYAREAAFRADVQAKLDAHLHAAKSVRVKNDASTNYQAIVFALNEISKDA